MIRSWRTISPSTLLSKLKQHTPPSGRPLPVLTGQVLSTGTTVEWCMAIRGDYARIYSPPGIGLRRDGYFIFLQWLSRNPSGPSDQNLTSFLQMQIHLLYHSPCLESSGGSRHSRTSDTHMFQIRITERALYILIFTEFRVLVYPA